MLFLSSGIVFAAQTRIISTDQQQAVAGAHVPAVENKAYRTHCGSCHFPYQPGLLPVGSWQKVLEGLGDHFGDNAELSGVELEEVSNYLFENAADEVSSPLGEKILATLVLSDLPLRISETPFFKTSHQILEMVLSEDVKKEIPYSNCVACHPGADEGDYNEDDTRIPGMVDWKRWHMQFQFQ